MNILQKYLNKDKHSRKIFAIREGTHKGCFFVYINTIEDSMNFLILPENQIATIPVKEFDQGVSNKIVDYIEKLPHNVYELCCAQYNESKAKSDINRLKQPAASSSMGS
jgi:hypothetical protein